MRQMTMVFFVASVVIIATAFGVERMSAQDTAPPVLRSAKTTLYTSPLHAGVPSCNILNTTDHDIVVEMHLVYTMGPLIDSTSVQATQTIHPQNTAMIGGGTIGLNFGALLYCTFTFSGPAHQVRAVMVNDGAEASEAR